MTSITYRHTGREQSSLRSGHGILAQISGLATKLADQWQQARNAREIESMSFDMRKDFGWPATDIDADRKDMQ